MEIVKEKQGICAVCGSDELDYMLPQFENDEVMFEYTCDKGHSGVEYYELEYTQTIGYNG